MVCPYFWIWGCFLAGADCRGGSLAVWGGAAGIALLLIGNKIPVVKNDILKKIPIVRGYFIEQDNIPDSDKPF
jgi:Ubiquinol-cytochrome-c reductase complex subunit (QCR10)